MKKIIGENWKFEVSFHSRSNSSRTQWGVRYFFATHVWGAMAAPYMGYRAKCCTSGLNAGFSRKLDRRNIVIKYFLAFVLK
jgi:hypothetical protein